MPFANKVQLIGNLGHDPQLRYFTNGHATVRLSVAYTEKWTDKTTGQPGERTDWFTVNLYGRPAETVCAYMKKGDCIAVWGKLKTRNYTDKDGISRSLLEIEAAEMQIIKTRQNLPENSENGGGTAYMD